jgi:hypothetical protein
MILKRGKKKREKKKGGRVPMHLEKRSLEERSLAGQPGTFSVKGRDGVVTFSSPCSQLRPPASPNSMFEFCMFCVLLFQPPTDIEIANISTPQRNIQHNNTI